MFNKFIILMSLIFLISCNSLEKKAIEDHEKQNLVLILKDLKEDLENNSTEKLELFFEKNMKNNYILNELKKINFENVKINYTAPNFSSKEATNIVALTFDDRTYYYDFVFELTKKGWKIITIKEKSVLGD